MIYRKSKGKYKDYMIEYLKEIEGRWIAECPEIPGCIVYGETKAEATTNLVELIERVKKDNGEENK